MKKFFSVFLMVCMLVTSLSVSASYDSTTNTYTFDTADEVARYYNNGEWKLANETGESVKLGDFSVVEKIGMNFKKIVLDDAASGTLTPANAATLSIRGEITEQNLMGKDYGQTSCGAEVFQTIALDQILKPIDKNDDGVLDTLSEKAVKYTMYAYSALKDGEPLSVDFTVALKSNSVIADLDHANAVVPASKLYSADGIPHKIDFILYFYTTTANTISKGSPYLALRAGLRYEIYIDGLYYSENAIVKADLGDAPYNKAGRYSWISPQINISSDGTNPVAWETTEMYICSDPSGKGVCTPLTDLEKGGEYLTVHSHNDIDTHLFQNILFGSSTVGNLRSDFMEGVDSAIASDLETLYTTAINGDRVLEVDASVYNSPASIWNADAESSSVSLVKIEDGTVYGVADKANVTESFDKYLISVNGVYTKVELAPVSYDAVTKTATVNVSKLPEGTEKLQIIVAAYNANGKMEKISVSESKTDFSSDSITHTVVDNTFPTDAYKYKVFVFDSLTSAKPLIEALEK